MKESNGKSGLKFSKIRGFFILILGIVFFTSGTLIKKRSENEGLNPMMGFGVAAMIVGFGLQAWEIGRKKGV